ncbi:MAG: 2-oxoacid:acceptor oxidoreductase family protein [Clostridia bacterium]|nr:2-oxoacid:acceptor oxidoreductase family protein [Clostridia bacterium]
MAYNILFAGFGGQGVQFAAKVTTYSGMMSGKEVSLLPSYGPEMRGGTSNCAVRIDDKMIASPIVNEPNILMALNQPSYDKFAEKVEEGGAIVFDDSLIKRSDSRTDISVYPIPATKLAREHGFVGLANMIALGYMAKKTGFLSLEIIKEGLAKAVPASKAALLGKNIEALEFGYNY